jgi:formylglycine-generating enzyme required for sulfatase activity
MDMHGNVREWCSDWYDKDYYAKSPASNPTGPAKPLRYRVVRGGSWNEAASTCRSTCRCSFDPSKSNDYTGFRVVCVPAK